MLCTTFSTLPSTKLGTKKQGNNKTMCENFQESKKIRVVSATNVLESSFWVVLSDSGAFDHENHTLITLPGSPFVLQIDIVLNGIPIEKRNHEALVELLSHLLTTGQYWKAMNLELSPCLTDESGLRFLVTCGLFTPMVLHRFGIDNKDLSFGPVLLNQLVQIGVRIDISMGGSPKSPTFELVELVNYLMVSNAMALETQFPMVFSFHARKLFRDNFDYLYSISSSLSGQQSNEEINHGFLLQISRQVTEGQNMIQIMATLSNSAQGRLKYLLMKRKKSGDGDEICAGQVLNLAVAKEVLRL